MWRKTGRQSLRLAWASFVMFVLIWASACGGDEPERAEEPEAAAAPAAPLRVVTTSNVIADWARVVGGEHVEVVSLMPVDVDPHTFQPGPRDAAQIAEADLILAVGLGMEGFWLDDLLRNVARDPSIVLALGELIDPIHVDPEKDSHADDDDHEHADDDEDEHADEDDHEHDEEEDEHADEDEEGHDDDENEHADEDEEGHDDDENEHVDEDEEGHADEEDGHVHGPENPHFWLDPIRAMIAVDAIAARFAELDPANADAYRANAAAYNEALDELHHWTEQQLSQVPQDHRLLLTSHDSFRYFAVRYGFEVVGVILGVTTDVEASAEHLAELADLMKERNVRAVFGETISEERLATALASEVGVPLVRLYSDSLGAEGSEAGTFIGMVRVNVARVVETLR